MNRIKYFILLLMMALMSCGQQKTIGENKNDTIKMDNMIETKEEEETPTISEASIAASKEEIFSYLKELDNWYRDVNKGLEYRKARPEGVRWKVRNKSTIIDEERITYVKDTILPAIHNSQWFTNNYKEKILNFAKSESDPGNLGKIICKDDYGRTLTRIVITGDEKIEFHILFNSPCIQSNMGDSETGTSIPCPEISDKEAKKYYFEMISLKNSNEAIFKTNYGLIAPEISTQAGRYASFYLKKNDEGKWQIDDIQYQEK